MIARREFLAAASAISLAVPPTTRAQQAGKVWRIGVIANLPLTTQPENAHLWDAFRKVLQERGYIEGKNLDFEWRYAEGRIERYPALAVELAGLKVDVIVVSPAPGVRAAMQATSTIPIVMSGTSDPVRAGLVVSLARPGGNVTGIADYQLDLVPKRLELLRDIAPKVARVANLHGDFSGFDAAERAAIIVEQEAAAQALGVSLLRIQMNSPQDFDAAVATIGRERPDALLLSPNPTNLILRNKLAEYALKQRLPTVAGRREEVVAGMLVSYGPSNADIFRASAVYVGNIFKGAKPGDLPIEQPTKFEMVINLKTAKALGLTIRQSLLLRADEVIQ